MRAKASIAALATFVSEASTADSNLKFPGRKDKKPEQIQVDSSELSARFWLQDDSFEKVVGALLLRVGCRDDLECGSVGIVTWSAADVTHDGAECLE